MLAVRDKYKIYKVSGLVRGPSIQARQATDIPSSIQSKHSKVSIGKIINFRTMLVSAINSLR